MNRRYAMIVNQCCSSTTTSISIEIRRRLPILILLIPFLIQCAFLNSSTLVTYAFQWSIHAHQTSTTQRQSIDRISNDPYPRIQQQQQRQQFTRTRESSSSSSSLILSLVPPQRHHQTYRTHKTISSCQSKILSSSSQRISTKHLSKTKRLSLSSLSSSSSTNTNELMSIRQGSTVALITPFHKDTGKIDYDSLQNLIRYHLDSGTDNLCVLGTTGEASVLSMDERQQLLTAIVTMVKGQIPIMVGCGTIDPNHVVEMMQQATDCGCDAALVVTPYYVKPPQRSLIRHYMTLADRSSIPLIIYNVPGRTAVDMNDESIAIAANHPNIIAVKDATGKLERLTSLQQQLIKHNVKTGGNNKNDKFLLFSGDDETSMEYVLNGGDGCISVTANVAAKTMHDVMKSALSNDSTMANKLNTPLIPLHKDLFCESNPMPVKYAANAMKLIASSHCRPPLDVLDTTQYGAIVDEALRNAGLL